MKLLFLLFSLIFLFNTEILYAQELVDINMLLSLSICKSDTIEEISDTGLKVSLTNETNDTLFISNPNHIYILIPYITKNENYQSCFSPSVNPKGILDFIKLSPYQTIDFDFILPLKRLLYNCGCGEYKLYFSYNGIVLDKNYDIIPTELCPKVKIRKLTYAKILKCKSNLTQRSVLKSNIITIKYKEGHCLK